MQPANQSTNKTISSAPYVVNSDLILPTVFSFRRHFSPEGRFFYRLHSQGIPSFTRTDTMNGDVLVYNPIKNPAHREIRQLYYFKPINELYAILVFKNLSIKHGKKIFISLIRVCHEAQNYTVLNKAEFRSFKARYVCQGTLIQNLQNSNQMACLFIKSIKGQKNQSCVTFFEILNGHVCITKEILFKTAIYFPRWNGHFVEGLFETDNVSVYNVQRYDLQNDTLHCLKADVLSVYRGDFGTAFCWYRNDFYIFVMAKREPQVYIQKLNLDDLKFTRIDLPTNNFFKISRESRFIINNKGIICYCETIEDGDLLQFDRFIRIPMKQPDSLLNKAWLKTRDYCEQTKKSFQLPFNFKYLSPICKLLQFKKLDNDLEEKADLTETSDLGQSSLESTEDAEAMDGSQTEWKELDEALANELELFANSSQ